MLLWFSHSAMPTLCGHMVCSMPGFLVLHCFQEFAQIHVHWISQLSNHLTLCFPLLLLPTIFPSITVFSSWLVLSTRWPKYWSFSFSISPSNEYSGLISFRMDYCRPSDSQESYPTPQFKSINSSVLSFLYSPTLTSIHNYWKNHSLD